MHRSFLLLALVGLSAIAQQPTDRPPQPRMDSIVSLHLPRLPGGMMPTYYSPGSESRARRLQSLIEGERAFYRAELGVPLNDLVLAVLNPQQWQPVSAPIPYGMPSVEGQPLVIVMPANWSEVTVMPLPEKSQVSSAIRSRARATGKSWTALMHGGADGIGAHELGHVIERDYGIDAQTYWFNEFLASYIGDVYIAEKHPQDLAANRLFWEACLGWPHAHATLAYFDSHYEELMERSPQNYGWYQCALDQRVMAVHAKEGVGFLSKVKAAFPKGAPKMTSEQVLDKLETIDPGWKAWAAGLDHSGRI